MRRLFVPAALLAALAATCVPGCGGSEDTSPAPDAAPVRGPTAGVPWFEDVTAASRIDFTHFDSATPEHYVLETMGSGLGWIDYDADGRPDLFCVQSGPVRPTAGGPRPSCKLFRNRGGGTFEDVTARAGLTRPGFGMGCAVGDYDNDGFDDLLVTYWGEVVLYHNEPDGKGGRRFAGVTARAGLHNPHWGTSAGWGDVDGDGLLDLYVCNYCDIPDLAKHPRCEHPATKTVLGCSPSVFPTAPHQLYRNNGDGTFTDISEPSGVAKASPGPGLGVVLCDLDGDGRLDIYVANDLKAAHLFHNQGGGRFAEKALFNGCAYGFNGTVIAGMGVEAGDVDGSGRPSLFVTNYQDEPNVLFRNQGKLLFLEGSYPSGLGLPSLSKLGFGTVFLDADLDGALDVAVANGHVQRHAQKLFGVPYEQEAQLFTGDGKGKFRDVSAKAGPYFGRRLVGRGLAWADHDDDGLPDLAFSNNAGPAALLRNATKTEHAWLSLELVGDGKKSNRNAIGSRVEVEAGGRKQTRFVNGGGSYLSASERRVLAGLGGAARAERVTVVWPSGRRQTFTDLAARTRWRLEEGKEKATPVVRR